MEEFLLALKPALANYLKFNQGGQLVVNELVSHKVTLSQHSLLHLRQILVTWIEFMRCTRIIFSLVHSFWVGLLSLAFHVILEGLRSSYCNIN